MFSVCVLLYGDYPDLASRCLQSIRNSDGAVYVQDIRLGLHNVSLATRKVVDREIALFNGSWGSNVRSGLLSSKRNYVGPAIRYDGYGFRVVLAPARP